MSVKKIVSAVLSVLIIAGAAFSGVSCANSGTGDDGEQNTSGTSAAIISETTEPGRESVKDGVPEDLKFSGKTFTILSREEINFGPEMGVEEENGDIVNDAIYRRNKKIEDRFDINIDVVKIPGIWGKEANFSNTVKNSVKAGDNAYNLIAGYAYFITPLAVEGNFLNWKKLQYIDYEAPWWSSELADKMTLEGKLYFISGDLSLTFIQQLMVLFFNKRIQQEYNTEDLYQLVLDGKWTYDKLFEISKNIYKDANGNGEKDEGDLFGMIMAYGNACDQVFVSQNQPMTQKNEDGYPYLVLNSAKTMKIAENMINLFFNNPGVYSFQEDTTYSQFDMFRNGEALITTGGLANTDKLRDMPDDFGVLPYPKYDEAQEKYMGLTQDAYSLFSVPATCTDFEFVGAVTEALAAESYRHLTPVYYETALKIKYSRDDATSQMLDIIRDGAQFDFAFVNSNSMSNIIHIFRELTNKKSADFVSMYEKNENVYQRGLDKIIEGYKNLD